MKSRKWNVWLAAVVLVTLAITGYFAIAAEYGSKDDPLVTLSYITEVLSPETMEKIDAALAEKQAAFDQQVNDKVAAVNKALDEKLATYQAALNQGGISDDLIEQIADRVIEKLGTGTGTTTAQSTWEVLKVPAGKKVICEVGCEIVLRINSASCYATSSPGLIDLSDGSTLENGKALVANHLYLASIQGRGFSSSGGCTVLINGKYTIQ
ncbi:MAG: hypothetical protein VB086_03040 [Clostridiaceae bacterium]|nr:hypothetical protein [Clostridiaceae bacterium]